MPTREVCKACGEESAVGFNVPDGVWQRLYGASQGVRCLRCFAKDADAHFIQWDNDIEFWPVSIVTHLEGLKRG